MDWLVRPLCDLPLSDRPRSLKWSCSNVPLLAYGTSVDCTVLFCNLPNEDNGITELSFESIRHCFIGSPVYSIAFSRRTCFQNDVQSASSVDLTLACASFDKTIRIFKDNESAFELVGHQSVVNDMEFGQSPALYDVLASVSDDKTCRFWYPDGSCHVQRLKSPGISVRFHSQFEEWIMIGEENGECRIFNINTKQWVLSLKPILPCGIPSFMKGADWAPVDVDKWSPTKPNLFAISPQQASLLDLDTEGMHVANPVEGDIIQKVSVFHVFSETYSSLPKVLATSPNQRLERVENISWCPVPMFTGDKQQSLALVAAICGNVIYVWGLQ